MVSVYELANLKNRDKNKKTKELHWSVTENQDFQKD